MCRVASDYDSPAGRIVWKLPDAKWMQRQAEAFLAHVHKEGLRVDCVIRDRDGKYVAEFDAALESSGVRVIATVPQAPNQNAFVERWGKSLREECLSHFIVFGQQHFDFLVSSFVDYYNRLRPH
jgi:putative transposase